MMKVYVMSTLILHQFLVIWSQPYRHSIMGEYFVEWREVGACAPDKRGTNEIYTDVRISRRRRKTEITGNVTFLEEFNDNCSVKLNFAILGSNLAWLPNAYSMTLPRACTDLLNLLGEGWTNYLKSMDMPPRCPIRKGFYQSKGYDADDFLRTSLFPKQFIYGRYRITVEFFNKKNILIGCSYFAADVLPLWQKKKSQVND